MNLPPDQCPLCSKFEDSPNKAKCELDRGKLKYHIKCERCGAFFISQELCEDRDGLPKATEAKLCLLSQQARRGSDRSGVPLHLTWDNWKDFDLRSEPSATVYYDRVLRELESHCKYPGDGTSGLNVRASAARCGLPTHVMLKIVSQLQEAKLLNISNANRESYAVIFTIDGWQRIEKLVQHRDPSRRAFVAMWFDPSLNNAYKAIAKMLEAEGYQPPFRVDDPEHDRLPGSEHQKKIDDRILAEIRGCRFVIADFTGNRPSVYYEAGFAEGLGIDIVWCCRRSDLGALTLDTRQNSHILWDDETDLAEQLQAKIRRHGWSWVLSSSR